MSADKHIDLHSALAWPFFEPRHRELAAGIEAWCRENLSHEEHAANVERDDVDATCRRLVRELGASGWLKYGVGGVAYGGHGDTIDTRAVCLLRETLAKHSGLADFAPRDARPRLRRDLARRHA